MKFELLILGEIKSGNAAKGRQENIYKIRKQIEPQLRRVWQCSPLAELDKQAHLRAAEGGIDLVGVSRRVCGTRFIPIICDKQRLAASSTATNFTACLMTTS